MDGWMNGRRDGVDWCMVGWMDELASGCARVRRKKKEERKRGKDGESS